MLDTNALSAWAGADAALLRVLPRDRLWHLSVVTLGEFVFGIKRSRDRTKLEEWLEAVKTFCAIVSVDADTAGHYARIREELRKAATPIPENDVWISAACRQHDLALASRDRHFDMVHGLKRVAW